MGVSIRGKKFHYRFQFQGQDYSGVCIGCEIPENASAKEIGVVRKKAVAFEKDQKDRTVRDAREREQVERDIRKNRTVRALVENYRYELTGGRPIPLKEAYALAASKPSRKKAAPRFAEQRETYFSDFTAFLQFAHPDVATIADVRRPHCEEYVSHLVEHGRFIKDVRYGIPVKRGTKEVSYRREYGLSPKTIRVIVGVCRWVFRRVAEDAGIVAYIKNGIHTTPVPLVRGTGASGLPVFLWFHATLFCTRIFRRWPLPLSAPFSMKHFSRTTIPER